MSKQASSDAFRPKEAFMPAYLGIDIAKRSFQCSLLLAGKRLRRTFPNSPDGFSQLDVWLAGYATGPVHACMEATNTYWEELAGYLQAQGHRVSVVNPQRIRDYARSKLMRNKTDKLDGDVIAEFCAAQHPEGWSPLPEEVRQLRDLVRHLEDLQEMRNQESNRLTEGRPTEVVRQLLTAHLAFLEQQISEVEERIQAH